MIDASSVEALRGNAAHPDGRRLAADDQAGEVKLDIVERALRNEGREPQIAKFRNLTLKKQTGFSW